MSGYLPFHLSALLRSLAACYPICLAPFFNTAAAELGWSASFNDGHKLSTGAQIPNGTRFQIGLFIDGFIPTAGNVADWALHWRSRGEEPFVDLGGGLTGFSGLLRVENNSEPFVVGAQLYIWGFRQTSTGTSEWILATDPSWTMPDMDPFSLPVFIDIADAAQVILGDVDSDAKSFATSPVPVVSSPEFRYAEWLAQEFLQVDRNDPLISARNADPDADGLTNIQEYTLGTSPTIFNSNIQSISVSFTPSGLLVQISVNPTAVRLWQLEGGDDLSEWKVEDADLVYNGVEQKWMRLHTVQNGRHFWRLRFD